MANGPSDLRTPPISVSHWTIYYGWVNVMMGALAMTATLPGRTHGLGLITKPLLDDLEMREQIFNYLNFWAILLGTLVAWPIASLIDRWGTRIVGGTLILGLGTSVVAMSFARDELLLFVGLFLVRALGQGALSVAATAMVGKWFSKRLGLAMGVFSMLLGIGFVVSTPSLQYAVELYGWREAWKYLGLALLFGFGPLTILLIRSKPSPDHLSEFVSDEPASVSAHQSLSDELKDGMREGVPSIESDPTPQDATLQEALCTPAFWVYSIASSMFGLTWSAIMLFYQKILEERGFDSDTYRLAMAIFVGVGLVANFLGGWSCRYCPMGRLLGIGLLLLAASLGVFPLISGRGEVLSFTAVFGAAGGIITVVYFAFYGQAFGQRELGRIQGAAHVLSVFGSALGPILLAWTRQSYGVYDNFFVTSMPVLLVLGLAAWWVPMPRHEAVKRFAD
jgi:MFS family permease